MPQLPTTEMRARRFPLRLGLHYRESGASKWQAGTTLNISCSGVLFRARERLEPLTPLELNLQLPRQLAGAVPMQLLCRGYVARAVAPRLGLGRPRVAAAFVQFHLLDGSRGRELTTVQRLRAFPEAVATSHRLNNLLAVILGTSELLLDREPLAEEVRDGLRRIREAATALAAELRRVNP